MLEWGYGVSCLLGEMLRKSSGHQTAEEVPNNNNPSDTTIRFPQRGHALHAEGVDNLMLDFSFGERVSKCCQQFSVFSTHELRRKWFAVMP